MLKTLKNLYSDVWMPFFGRLLFKLVPLIEGKKSNIEPTYKFTKEYEKD